MKVFDVRDGQGIVLWHGAGFKSGIISGRHGEAIIQRRAAELGIEFVHTGCSDKVAVFDQLLDEMGIDADDVAYIGDDVGDIEILKRVGFAVAVADAVPETKAVADYVTQSAGGRGAVREVIDMLLSGIGN